MTNLTYNVNIAWTPLITYNTKAIGTSSVTTTTTGGYYIASMPEVRLYATGSSYTNALSNLIAAATASSEPGNPPLSNDRYW